MDSPRDAEGNLLQQGDTVLVLRIPEWLPRGLPQEDQQAINGQAGRELLVIAFDEHGYVELEFLARNGGHTIWIDGGSLRKVSPTKPGE